MLCDDSKDLHPKLITCPVKDGIGSMTKNFSTVDTLASIRELSEKALKQNLSDAVVILPESFELEVCFKEHIRAERVTWFPGVKRKDDNTVTFCSNDYFEILRTVRWIV